MAVVDQYTSHVLAGGQIDSRATPNDFGAQVGQGLEAAGQGMGQLAQGIQEQTDTQDITSVHVELAKKRAQWTQEMQTRENNAVPGDDTFAPKLMDDISKDINSIGDNLTSRKAQRLLATMGATMTSEFGQMAIGVQAKLAGQAAINSYDELVRASGQTVYADQSQYEVVLRDAELAIKNGEGMFGKIPQTKRDELMAKVRNDINLAAARGFVRNNPEALLSSVAPDQLESNFKPAEKVVQSNNAPGASASVSAGAMRWAPLVQRAAATNGVNPNILLAQIDKESRGNPNAVNSNDIAVTGYASVGLAQFQPATAKQYGIDPTKPDQAIKGQAAYMADLLRMYGGNYQKALAAYNWGPGNLNNAMSRWGNAWPEKLPASVKDYVSTIMANAGQVAQPQQPPAPTAVQPDATAVPSDAPPTPVVAPDNSQRKPVASSLPFFNNLSWQEQDAVVGEAVRLQHLKMQMAERARVEAERRKKEAQEKTMDGYLTGIVTPDSNRPMPTEDEIMHDQTLDWQQKQHLVDYKLRREREVAAGEDQKTNPIEVRQLMLQIHAADDDPSKSYNLDPVMESYKSGHISTAEMKMLRTEVEQMRDGTTQGFQKDVNSARNAVYTALTRSILGQVQPEVAADAAYRFNADMEQRIAAMRKENKDPRTLLDPNSRDYLLKPERIQSFMPNGANAAAQGAAKVVGQEAQKMAPGTVMNGYRYKGGDPANKANWEAVK